MSTYIQWSLYGKDASGAPISEEKAYDLRNALDDEVTEWHGDAPDGECVAQFLTTYNNGYSNIIDIIGDYAKVSPDCMFQLFCHNEDEDWYQQIHFRGDDCEVLDGHIVYDPPQRIFYDAPELQKEVCPMIYTRTGSGFTVDGVFYFVGMYVHANNTSDFAGLYGVVTEIRTDDNRENENDTPDIYCQFDVPVLPCEVRELEARFSSLYGQPKKLDELSLDMVIMAPEMLEPSIDPNAANPATHVWAVIEDWAVDDETGHDESLFVSREDAVAVLHSKLSTEATEGCIPRWKDKTDFQLVTSENSYECWLDGDYLGNHYKISIEQKPLVHKFTPKEESK